MVYSKLVSNAKAVAATVVRGKVVLDAATGQTLGQTAAGAVVSAEQDRWEIARTKTDSNGAFELSVPAGGKEFRLLAGSRGLLVRKSVAAAPGQQINVELRLQPSLSGTLQSFDGAPQSSVVIEADGPGRACGRVAGPGGHRGNAATGTRFILIHSQGETNYPRPSGQLPKSLSIG